MPQEVNDRCHACGTRLEPSLAKLCPPCRTVADAMNRNWGRTRAVIDWFERGEK